MTSERPTRMQEHAWTLIELIIAMSILGVLMAFAGPSLVNSARNATASTSDANASSDVRSAVELFASDMAGVKAPWRGSSREEIITALDCTNGPACRSPYGATPSTYPNEFHDIAIARPDRFAFWSDTLSAVPGTEFVEWHVNYDVRVGNQRQWRIIRTVYSETSAPTSAAAVGASGTPLTSEIVAYGNGDFPVSRNCPDETSAPSQRAFCFAELSSGEFDANYAWSSWRVDACAAQYVNAFNTLTDSTVPANLVWTSWSAGNPYLTVDHVPADTFGNRRSSRLWHIDRIAKVTLLVPSAANGSSARRMQVVNESIASRSTEAYGAGIMCHAR